MKSGAVGNIIINAHGEGIGLLKYHAYLFPEQRGIHPLIVNILSVQQNSALDFHILHQIIHPVDAL